MFSLKDAVKRCGALVLVSMAAPMAFAQTTSDAIDVTAVVTKIAAQAAPIASIGAAVLLLVVGIKAFHWVRRALNG